MTFVEFTQLLTVGGSAGAIVSWLGREWISNRLKQAIEYEYASKLESVRNDFNLKVQGLGHQNEVARLRTSLFFDHQRNAFAEILVQVETVNSTWVREGYDDQRGEWVRSVSYDSYKALRELCVKHQLFLDVDSTMALEVLFTAYAESFADPDDGGVIDESLCGDSFGRARYVQRRLTGLFQQLIGVGSQKHAVLEIALLGGVLTVNRYSSLRVGKLHDESPLKLPPRRSADDVVEAALKNVGDLKTRLAGFIGVLQTRADYQDEVAQARRFIAVFERFSL